MDFLYPNFLYGLIAIIFPILVHLFNFQRYKVVYFSNFQFLQNLQMQTKRHSDVKRWLLLLLRILIILFIVLAFAHPYFTDSTHQKSYASNTVCVFVDNSFSMGDKGDGNSIINEAKASAKQIAQSFAPSDRFILLTNDMLAEQFRTLSREDFLNKVDEVKVNGASKSYAELFTRIADLFTQELRQNKYVYVLSDFQKSAFDFTRLENDTTLNVRLIHFKHPNSDNIAIDSSWFEPPILRQNQNLSLFVKVHNYSNHEVTMLPVSLKINGKEVATAIVDIAPNSSSVVPLNFVGTQVGVLQIQAEINDPGEINFDDAFYVSAKINSTIEVLEIFEKQANPFLKAIFETDSIYRLVSVDRNAVNYGDLAKYQLILLSQPSELASGTASELAKYVKQGGLLCFTPPATAVLDPSIHAFLKSLGSLQLSEMDSADYSVLNVNVNHPIYRQVFDGSLVGTEMPIVTNHFAVIDNGGVSQRILQLTNMDCILGVTQYEQGQLYVFGIAPDDFFGNFSHHPLIVPTFINMPFARIGIETLYSIMGRNEMIRLRNLVLNGDNVIKLLSLDKKTELIPQIVQTNGEVHLYDQNQISVPGNYRVMNEQEEIAGVSYNYGSMESNMDFFNSDDLAKLIAQNSYSNVSMIDYQDDVTSAAFERSTSMSLWKWLILLALLLVTAEILVLKFWK